MFLTASLWQRVSLETINFSNCRLRSALLSSEGFDTGIKCLRDLITLGSNEMEIAAEAVAETGKVVTIAGIFRFYKDVVMDASPSCQELRIFRVLYTPLLASIDIVRASA
jgi:hypothetical protein